MERETGIEPVTSSLGSWRSTAELLPLAYKVAESSYKVLIISTLQWMPPEQSVRAIPRLSRLSKPFTDTMDTTPRSLKKQPLELNRATHNQTKSSTR